MRTNLILENLIKHKKRTEATESCKKKEVEKKMIKKDIKKREREREGKKKKRGCEVVSSKNCTTVRVIRAIRGVRNVSHQKQPKLNEAAT